MTLLPYETSDVYLASYLLCQGGTLLETERVGPRRTIFRFESDQYLHALLRVYWQNDDIVVPATRMFDTLRGLKSRIRKKPQRRTPGPGDDVSGVIDSSQPMPC